jgi:PRA1 family protein 1
MVPVVLQVEDRGGGRLATHRPWRELTNPLALSFPPRGLANVVRRAGANLRYFSANYAALVLVAVFLPLFWRPVAQLAFLACMLAWLALFFLRDEPFALCSRAVPDGAVLAALSALTLAVLLVAGPVVSVLKALSWAPASSCSTPCCTRTP